MDHQDIIEVLPNKRRNKMLIDSGDEGTHNGKQTPLKISTEKKQSATKVKHHQVDRKQLKYLFEPDESLSEGMQFNFDQTEEEERSVEKPILKKKTEQPKRSNILQAVKVKDSVQIDSLEDLRIEILKRWWYCLGEWPPVDYDYSAQLNLHKLRRVDYVIFKKEQEIDDRDFRKVYSVEGFPGIYKSSAGDTFDLRPQESCPSFDNIRKINPKHLPKLYIKGLKAQLQDLQSLESSNESLISEIRTQIMKSEKKFQQYLE